MAAPKAAYTSPESLRALADIALKSDEGLKEFYDVKEGIEGAQMGGRHAIERRTGVSYALNRVEVCDLHPRKCAELATAILAQRRITDHPHDDAEVLSARLACVHQVLQAPDSFYLAVQLAPTEGVIADDLLTMIEKRSRLPEPVARSIFVRLVLATKRAHDCGVVLRNLKPETVQVCMREAGGEYEVVVADLHCAAMVDPDDLETPSLTGLHGTPEYCAPEVSIWYARLTRQNPLTNPLTYNMTNLVSSRPSRLPLIPPPRVRFWHETDPPRLPEPPPAYGAKADLWSLGICLHVMLCGCFPFSTLDADSSTSLDEEALLRRINEADFSFEDPGWQRISDDAKDLIQQLLQRDPADRPFIEDVLQHPFCTEALQEVMTRQRSHSGPLGDLAESALAMLDED